MRADGQSRRPRCQGDSTIKHSVVKVASPRTRAFKTTLFFQQIDVG